mmetsp:Transcript_8953/g.20154  ORF Transcript_8953/g.20154 Transcript_8953/m.20154 type:complete len:80 (+) Transcript_8953:1409-1648(+)
MTQTQAVDSLYLSLFGMLSLMAHAGYYFSNEGPFLGMSEAIINLQITVACVSTLIKEGGTKDWYCRCLLLATTIISEQT